MWNRACQSNNGLAIRTVAVVEIWHRKDWCDQTVSVFIDLMWSSLCPAFKARTDRNNRDNILHTALGWAGNIIQCQDVVNV